MTVERSSKRPLRADAARNRDRILASAREVFGAKGLDVSLDDIAHHAGVGVPTLYRRFPDRESLIVTLFEMEMLKTIKLAIVALAAADPWEGFTTLVRSIFGAAATDRGMREALVSSRHGLGAATPNKIELVRLLSLIVRRAQQTGSLRKGTTAQNIPIMMLMVSVVADFASNASPRLWERYCTLLIDGLSAHRDPQPLAPDAMSESEMAFASSLW